MSNVVANNDILVSEIVTAIPGQISINTRYWLAKDPTGGDITFAQCAVAIDTAVSALYRDLMWEGAMYYGVRVRRTDPPGEDRWGVTIANSANGNVAGATLPSQTCGLISFDGTVRGRKGGGRLYIPFPAIDDNAEAGVPTAGYIARAELLAAVFSTNLTVTVAGNTRVLHPHLQKVFTDPPNEITAAKVRPSWATQRRRGAFGRLNPLPW